MKNWFFAFKCNLHRCTEEFGKEPGVYSGGQMVAALRALGLHRVVDTNTAADLCICEEGTELLQRLLEAEEQKKKQTENAVGGEPSAEDPGALLPMFTSCCPGWGCTGCSTA